MAKAKKKKMEKLPKIRRRLMKLWSEKVRLAHGDKCAVSGMPNGTVIHDKPQKLDSHHIESRIAAALRFDIMNGIALNVWHHKFGKDSFHRSPIWSMDWLAKNRPKQYEYIMAHRNDKIDLDDRNVLQALENKLKEPPTPEELELLGSKFVWDGKAIYCEDEPKDESKDEDLFSDDGCDQA